MSVIHELDVATNMVVATTVHIGIAGDPVAACTVSAPYAASGCRVVGLAVDQGWRAAPM